MTFQALAAEIHKYFAERNISTETFTVVLNFADSRSALLFDLAVAADFESYSMLTDPTIPQRRLLDFRCHGIDFQLKSPLHD